MPAKETQPAREHLDYLDSVRGIAAIMVMVSHFINWKFEGSMKAKVAALVFSGSDTVSFFFVLSGFVLSYKYLVRGASLDIRNFYISRVFRLWPAFFVIVLLCALNAIRYDLGFQNLVNVFLLDRTGFWEEAILIRSHPKYYGPGWTLAIELVMSFAVPFFILIAKKGPRTMYWLLAALLLIGGNTFAFHFALGVLLSCIFTQVQEVSFRQTAWYRYHYLILAVSVVLFSLQELVRIFPLSHTYTGIADYLGITLYHYSGLASFVFIVAILCSNMAKKMLRYPLLRFFGKISYGMYLVHWMLAEDIYFYWNRLIVFFPDTAAAFMTLFIVYFLLSVLLATILHYAIELPFIRIGKRITDRMKPSLQFN